MPKRTKKFKTEVQQLLDLVIHSLYSKKEIYLRELVSNASDAIDRLHFEALTKKKLLEGDPDGKIKIHVDKDARTITISDNGIGMSAEETEQNIGTIANSGTRNFLENLKKGKGSKPEFIGQFGVGFYASFMVADKVTVLTRRAGSEAAVLWVSEGAGNYTISDAEKESRGTDITLHLREGMEKHLEEWEIRQTIKSYSDYIAYPIVMDVVRKQKAEEGEEEVETVEEETLNSMKAIWKKSKSDVSAEEYNEFYHHVSHEYSEPLKIIHYAAEGATEFRALLYIPSQAPFDLFWPERQHGIHLYVRNVYITDDCKELLPPYLRFVRGVVDSSDLPLNVSREMLQDDAIIRRISKSCVSKVLGALSDMMTKERDAYAKFYEQFGKVIKEGVHSDFENYDKLKDLLLFHSTQTEDGKPVSLREYVDRMPQGQKEIYYLTADSAEAARLSPHIEALRKKDIEVLFFVDPIDEWVVQRLTDYDGKKLKPADRGELGLEGEDEEARKEKREKAAKKFGDVLEFIQKKLDEDVKEVRISDRLTDSACCLVADETGMNAHMERIMRAMNQDVPKTKRILEVNGSHPLLKKISSMYETSKRSKLLSDYIDMLYDQALIAEGGSPRDPQKFTQLVSKLMAKSEG